MRTKMMYNPLESVFNSTMEREGVVCTTYTGDTEFQCFFRIRDDGENQKDTITIFYDVNAPVRAGTLISYDNVVFLALNRETVENDVYYKSVLVKCNGTYNENGRVVENVPFYSDNMKSSISVGNNVITTLDGNVELLTEENGLSKKIEINQTFNEFGRTFKVSNLYSMDGILHIIAKVAQDVTPTYNYSLVIDGIPSEYCKSGDSVQLSATAYVNDSVTTGATIEWESSDNAVATVDSAGLVNCIAEGTVNITAIWTEHNVNQSAAIVISNSGNTPTYICSISGGNTLRLNRAKSWTVAFESSAGEDITDSVTYEWSVISDFNITQSVSGNKITLKTNEESYLGKTFVLQIITDEIVIQQINIELIDGL